MENKPFMYYDKWVLIDVYFYKFWMLRTDFNKYNIQDTSCNKN